MKNVAFIIGHLSHGGAEKQLYLICKTLDRQKFNPIVFCLSRTKLPWGEKIESSGIQVIYFQRFSRFDVTRVFRLAFYYYTYRIDIIVSLLHIGMVYAFLSRCLYFRRSYFIPQIRSKESSMKGMVRWLNIRALNASDRIVVNSQPLIEFIEEFFKQPKEKIFIVRNGIEDRLEDTTIKKSSDSGIHIGTIGKDTWDKNIPLFIQTAVELLRNQENVFFHVCGRDLDSENRFWASIPENWQDRFHFYGEIDDVSAFLNRLDIYLSTSNTEGLPNAIMEAMMANVPVVATDVGGVSELVKHNDAGYLTPPGNLHDIVASCRRLIVDEQRRTTMGQRGHAFISRNFSVDRMQTDFERILDSLGEGITH